MEYSINFKMDLKKYSALWTSKDNYNKKKFILLKTVMDL